ncbi:HPr(Ser) kinase/phosphatase [Agrilactobacillus fermenti]|uniref:HPr(Ser) kinase/phosphatase n=1 Tax=Agrilactobacillus fermenti TaxID=2586909 RepID=UPI001E498F6D|nr:HPr(Ser) kinase/phosphatase [Agrilactobacillus fermenti]MCD2256844.1 HPr kinase/phosphorylase [Agrilactobacillus fermenti]
MVDKVSVKDLAQATHLSVFSGKEFLANKFVTVSDISRPGLELTGYFNFYPEERIQLFGMTEISFSKNMTSDERFVVMSQMARPETPMFLVSRNLPAPKEMIEAATKHKIPVLGSKLPTTRLSSLLTEYLDRQLAERRSIHGVLVDIYGVGVMITGDSGVGKSETALELVKRGHRLIADDRVDVYQQDEQTIVGEAPAILKHLLEIRGLGIIDVMNLFGAGAVREETPIDLIVHLENWSADRNYDRLGSGEQYQSVFDVDIPKITVPVKVGRNLAIIIEVAAMNFRAKSMGYDATKVFEKNLNELIQQNEANDENQPTT